MHGKSSHADAGAEGKPDPIAELFHALNQPLTSLQCALELSLQRPRSGDEYRRTLGQALEQAETISRLAGGIRDLLQADDPGDRPEIVSFAPLLREAVDDLRPVAESLRVRLLWQQEVDGSVHMEPRRLRQALFSLIEFVMNRSRAGAAATIEVEQEATEFSIRISSNRPNTSTEPSSKDAGVAVARRICQAAGGSLVLEENRSQLRIDLHLPRAAPAVE